MLRGRPLSVAELIDNGTLSAEWAAIAAWTIEHGASVVVAAGPSGAGKSTLATALLEFLPETAVLYITFLIAVVVAGRNSGRIVRQVAELGFLPPSGEIQTLADLGVNSPHLQSAGLDSLATWSGVPVERIELEVAARAARFANC